MDTTTDHDYQYEALVGTTIMAFVNQEVHYTRRKISRDLFSSYK